MSDLGFYQTLTTAVKRLGGPVPFCLVSFGVISGISIIAYKQYEKSPFKTKVDGLAQSFNKRIKSSPILLKAQKKNMLHGDQDITYVVYRDCSCEGGLTLRPGDRFTVVMRDEDAVLIAVHENENSPFFVSVEFLEENTSFTENEG